MANRSGGNNNSGSSSSSRNLGVRMYIYIYIFYICPELVSVRNYVRTRKGVQPR